MSHSDHLKVSNQGVADLLGIVTDDSEGANRPNHPALELAAVHGYKATELLGEGGLAEVWHGIDENTGRDVAIKVARRDIGSAAKLIKREAEILSRIGVGGVVSIIRQGGTGNDRYLVADFVMGLPLDDYLTHAAHSDSQIVQLATQLCETLQRLHESGYAHGDIKPSNIIVSSDGTPVFIDLALAQKLDQAESLPIQPQTRGGTAIFLAPELVADRKLPATRASDIFALGMTIRVSVENARKHLTKQIADVLNTAVATDPEARPASAADLAGALAMHRPADRRSQRGLLMSAAVLAAAFVLIGVYLWPVAPEHLGVTPAQASLLKTMDALEDGRPADAKSTLDAVPVADREWEWRHLWSRATQPPAAVRRTFDKPGVSAALAPAGKGALIGTWEGEIRFEPSNGPARIIGRIPEGAPASITHIASTGNAGLIIADSNGNLMTSPDGADPELIAKTDANPAVMWFDDVKGTVCLWDSPSGEVRRVDPRTGRETVLSRAGLVALAPSAPGWTLELHESKDMERRLVVLDPARVEHYADDLPIGTIALSVDVDPDTGTCAVGMNDGTVRIYGPDEAEPRVLLTSPGDIVTAVALSLTEERLFAAGKELNVVDLVSGDRMLTFPIDVPGLVQQITWEPESGTLSIVTGFALLQWIAPPQENLLALR